MNPLDTRGNTLTLMITHEFSKHSDEIWENLELGYRFLCSQSWVEVYHCSS